MENEKKDKKKFRRSLFHKIVNVFIGFFAVLLFLLIVFFGFSQTKTFRNYLKDLITENVSESINGDLKIENIEGSILSSIILQNTVLTSMEDTVFKADEITVKTSPIHILLKRILIRDLILKNAKFKLLEEPDGNWNISNLSNQSDTVMTAAVEPEDSTEGDFPFTIQVNNLSIEDMNFIMQTKQNRNSSRSYKFMNTSDLQLRNLNINGKVFLNLASSTARLKLNNFSVHPNFDAFNLNNLSGEFELTQNYASVRNLNFESDSSNIEINAVINELNLLGGVELRDFKEYPLNLDLKAYPIEFSDLYTFIKDTDFLNGKVYMDLNVDGYFGDFDINNLKLNFKNTLLDITGKMKDLHTPEKLFLDVKINDSKIVESEVYTLLQGLEIPNYHDLVIENLNASFKGEPTKFNAKVNGDIKEGNLEVETYLDLQKEKMEYDVKYSASNIDLFPVVGFSTFLTSSGKIKGVGTDPNNMNANLEIYAFDSVLDSVHVDSLNLITTIESKFMELDLSSIINGADAFVQGSLNLLNEKEPIYDLIGTVNKLRLDRFTGDPSDSSNLNLEFKADGKNLEIDEMEGNYEISLKPSYLRDLALDETSITLSIDKNDLERDIKLKSEFADLNIDGQFSLQKAIDILSYETNTITTIISNKINELNPILESDSLKIEETEREIPAIAKEELEFSYNFVFKDFDLIAEFLKNDELDIVGSGEGTVKNDSLHFEISTDLYIENLLNKKKSDIIYFSEVEANLNFSRDNRFESFNKIFGTVSIEGEKIYTGIEMNELIADLVFNQSKLFFNTSFNLEDEIFTEIEGTAFTTPSNERIDISNISINYKDIPWVNYDTCVVIFNNDGAQLSNLVLNNGSTVVEFDAQVNNDESHNLFLNVESMPGEVLSAFLLAEQGKPLGGDININVESSGFLSNPEMTFVLDIFNVSYNNVEFGSLSAAAIHSDNSTLIDIDFNNYEISPTSPILTIDASLPLRLNLLEMNHHLDDRYPVDISLRSNNFDIGTLGNVLPAIKNQSGKFSSKIDVVGPINDLSSIGYFSIEDGRFTARGNNLDYAFSLKTTFHDNIAKLESISLSNAGGSRYTGTVEGSGEIMLDKFPYSEFDLVLYGDLALLGRNSKRREDNIFGDLLVVIKDKLDFSFRNDLYTLNGDIIIERADLNYSAQRNLNAFSNDRIVYNIIKDTSKISINNQKFVRILNETKNTSIELDDNGEAKFIVNSNIIINNIASLNILISPELNQRLRIETTGQIEFETIGNDTKAQGSLALRSGSTLEFFKTFDATGTIRFENDITDPYFDIVATYIGEIDNFENTEKTEEVAVKLKILSTFSELRDNLSGVNNNLSVYVGRSNIENDIPDSRYDQSNALTFVIFDQLSLKLNDEQRSTLGSLTENAAYSLLGSQLTNYLNSSLGGLISNIKLNRYSGGDSYRLLFSGRYKNIRYSFGGSFGSKTDYLQLSKADIRVEYLFNPNFLIRLEQKDPIIESTTQEKIQEVGLKYKFEF